jgi:hypothetical protein
MVKDSAMRARAGAVISSLISLLEGDLGRSCVPDALVEDAANIGYALSDLNVLDEVTAVQLLQRAEQIVVEIRGMIRSGGTS